MSRLSLNDASNNIPKIWGIINITPDSFSDGGLFLNAENAYVHAEKLIHDGADYLDIGAASSRPNAEFICEEEEWQRLEPFFNLIEEKNKELFARLSVDTWRASIAQRALEKGVFCINDISALQWDRGDKTLLDVLLEYKPYYVLMHCHGTPQNMQCVQNLAKYNNVVDTVLSFFEERLSLLQKSNFPMEKVILDVGIGFGKNLEQNLALLNAGKKFSSLGFPLMSAISRKSWLRELLSIEKENIKELDTATTNASLLLHKQGFLHHRVHNVKEHKRAFCLEQNLKKNI